MSISEMLCKSVGWAFLVVHMYIGTKYFTVCKKKRAFRFQWTELWEHFCKVPIKFSEGKQHLWDTFFCFVAKLSHKIIRRCLHCHINCTVYHQICRQDLTWGGCVCVWASYIGRSKCVEGKVWKLCDTEFCQAFAAWKVRATPRHSDNSLLECVLEWPEVMSSVKNRSTFSESGDSDFYCFVCSLSLGWLPWLLL